MTLSLEQLSARMRQGEDIPLSDTARIALALSIPSILEQLVVTAMEYIDAAMVGHIGAKATAAIGIVSSSTWLLHGILVGLYTAFSIQIAQYLGADRQQDARGVLRQSMLFNLILGLGAAAFGVGISRFLPGWLGADISLQASSSAYFAIWSAALPFTMAMGMYAAMLRATGDALTPSLISVLVCALDVVFNFFLINPTRQILLFGQSVTVWGAGLEVPGVSVPLAFFSGIGAGSKYGILFKGGVTIEALKNVKAVVMDKTGTVTKGNFVVQKLVPVSGMEEDELLKLCASAELVSSHPIATSIVNAAKERELKLERPQTFEEIAGEGLVVEVSDGKILCGNKKLLERFEIDFSVREEDNYGTEVLVARAGKYLGQIIIDDTLKEDAVAAVTSLKKMNLTTAMLTGDAAESAQAVARAAGIDEVRAKLLPQDKLNELGRLRKQYGGVMFVGDGINDAPVLAGADVGATMGSGADAAIEAADVVFMNSEMQAIPQAIALAKETTRIAWQNVFFALAIKIIIMAAGLAGYASMWAAVFADTGVSILCVLNSIRILYKKI